MMAGADGATMAAKLLANCSSVVVLFFDSWVDELTGAGDDSSVSRARPSMGRVADVLLGRFASRPFHGSIPRWDSVHLGGGLWEEDPQTGGKEMNLFGTCCV